MADQLAPVDPVLELVTRYRTVEQDYDTCNDDTRHDALRDAHTAVMHEVCETTTKPASIEGALAAIRQALAEETRWSADTMPLTVSFLRMGLSFFEGPVAPTVVADLIKSYEAAADAWEATMVNGNLPADGPEHDRFYETEDALIHYQCRTAREANEKIAYYTASVDFRDAALDGEDKLAIFMKSLVVGRPVDNGEK